MLSAPQSPLHLKSADQVRQIYIIKKRSRIGSLFRAFQFHLMIKTDLRDGTTAGTAEEKEMLLKEHLRARTGHERPLSISGLVVFCDRSLFSQPPDSDGLVSIEVLAARLHLSRGSNDASDAGQCSDRRSPRSARGPRIARSPCCLN